MSKDRRDYEKSSNRNSFAYYDDFETKRSKSHKKSRHNRSSSKRSHSAAALASHKERSFIDWDEIL